MTCGVEILAVASALPERVVGNAAIADRLGVTDDWIRQRTGIQERRHAAPGTSVTDLAAEAGGRALTTDATIFRTRARGASKQSRKPADPDFRAWYASAWESHIGILSMRFGQRVAPWCLVRRWLARARQAP